MPGRSLLLLPVLVGLGIAVEWASTANLTATPLAMASAFLAASAGIPLYAVYRLRERDWFHPFAFPLTYVAVVLLLPSFYMLLTQRELAAVLSPSHATKPVLVVFALTVAGLAAGTFLALSGTPAARRRAETVDFRTVRRVGRFLFPVVLAVKVVEYTARNPRVYGEGQTEFGWLSTVTTMAYGLVFVAVVLVVIGNSRLDRQVMTRLDVGLFGFYIALSFGIGNRGQLLGPLLFILWAHNHYVRPIRAWRLAAATVAIVLAFGWVSQARIGRQPLDQQRSIPQLALFAVSSPTFITSNVMREVPERHPTLGGSTYVEAIKRQLPGPIAVATFGEPTASATYVYRRLIHWTNPNHGFGFAFPAEAYLNFGRGGVVALSLAFGGLLGFAYRKQRERPTRAVHLLYPILVTTLPQTLRADSVTLIKLVAYPMIVLAVVFWWTRRTESDEGHKETAEAAPCLSG